MSVAFSILDSVEVSNNVARPALMAAREFVLLAKRTARQGGFGEVAGRMIRETVGYKFDAMGVDDVLKACEADDFLTRYGESVKKWDAGLKKSAGEATLKANAAKVSAAMGLAADPVSFRRLIKALRILCVRNQSWQESGNNLALPMNGHKALLDLFNINVTNNRRLSLTASM